MVPQVVRSWQRFDGWKDGSRHERGHVGVSSLCLVTFYDRDGIGECSDEVQGNVAAPQEEGRKDTLGCTVDSECGPCFENSTFAWRQASLQPTELLETKPSFYDCAPSRRRRKISIALYRGRLSYATMFDHSTLLTDSCWRGSRGHWFLPIHAVFS